MSRVRRIVAIAAAAAVLALSAGAGGAAEPVVFAVDTSRSLTADDLARVRGTLGEVLETLAAGTPTSLLAFDDTSRWIVPLPGSPEEVRRGLEDLAPRGDYTLLHDALFTAARALTDGGVVVLVTDGRDENSATTVEDVADLARRNGVRVLPLLVGRRDGSLPLRRLALLTDGAYLGRIAGDEAAARVREALAAPPPEPSTREASAPSPAAAETAPPTPAAIPEAPGGVREESSAAAERSIPERAGPSWVPFLGAFVALAGLAVVLLLVRRRHREPIAAYCPNCGSELAEGESCLHCEETERKERLLRRPVARLEDTAELALGDFEEVAPDATESGILEKTRILTEHHVLVVREPGRPPQSYLLRREEAFAIGRDPDANTLALSDPALSARHLRIVPEDGRFFVVDVGSTNGTFLGEDRVEARRLRPGDVVRAGQLGVEYRVVTRPVG